MTGPLRRRGALIVLVASIGCARAQTVTYSDSSSAEKLESQVGFAIGEEAFSLEADMTLVGEGGATRVLPRVSSSWSGGDFLDVETVLLYEDMNRTLGLSSSALETRVQIAPSIPFVERLDAELRRSAGAANDTLSVAFSELETAFSVLGGDPLDMRADVTLLATGEESAAESRLTSTWGLGETVDVKSVLRVAEDPSVAGPTLDTTLVYDAPVAFIDKIEGEVRRTSIGAERQSLALLFPELSTGDAVSAFTISSKAVLEEMLQADGVETVSMGVETKLSGFMPDLLGGRNALSLKLERMLDTQIATSSLAYDHSWSPSEAASIGFNLKVLRNPDDVEPSMGLTWSTEF
ncbi:MAG TPA: hypothetical protein VF329_11865 [Gammaproteobacteria bacterium]